MAEKQKVISRKRVSSKNKPTKFKKPAAKTVKKTLPAETAESFATKKIKDDLIAANKAVGHIGHKPEHKPLPFVRVILFAFGLWLLFMLAYFVIDNMIKPDLSAIIQRAQPRIAFIKEAPYLSWEKNFVPEEPLDGKTVEEDTVKTTPAPASTSVSTPFKPKADEIPLWQKNAVKVTNVPDKAPVIAIIIDDMGINKKVTKDIMDLPAPITTSFITYAKGLPTQIHYAQNKGKEIMLHLPMQAANPNVDSGPNTFTVDMNARETLENLETNISKELWGLKIAGANNHMGSEFTKDEQSIERFMNYFADYGLYFIDSVTTSDSKALTEADKEHIAAAARNVFIDNEDDKDYILKQLASLEKIAKKKGRAIGIGHPHEATVEALRLWLPTLKGKGLYIVPASFIVQKRIQGKAQ